MGVVTVSCVTCDIDAPGIGHDGYLGTPDLSTVIEEDTDPEDLPFGYLYEPLRAVGLRPRDLEAMHGFLKAHESHQVFAWSNAQDEDDWPAELAELLSERDKRGDADPKSRSDQADLIEGVDRAKSEWAVGRYAAHCLDCRMAHQCEDLESLRPFDRLPLESEAVEMMLARWGELAPDDGWNDGLPPVVDPYGEFMEGLLAFLEQHRLHRLEARLDRVG